MFYFVNMFWEEKLLADFILQTECAFTTVDRLNISMFRLLLRSETFSWIFGSFGISKTLLHVFPLFIYCFLLLSVMANMQQQQCVKRSNALLPWSPGPTPSVTKWIKTKLPTRVWELSFLSCIYCVHAWGEAWSKHEKDPCMIQRPPLLVWSMEFPLI